MKAVIQAIRQGDIVIFFFLNAFILSGTNAISAILRAHALKNDMILFVLST